MMEKKTKKTNSTSSNSDTDLNYSDSEDHKRTEKTDTSSSNYDKDYTSISDDDSLGLLSEEQTESSWFGDSEKEELISNFQNLKFDDEFAMKKLPEHISLPKSKKHEEAEISPICAREKSSNMDLSTLHSTPKNKESLKEVIERHSTTYQNTLSISVKIRSIHTVDETVQETFTSVESYEESNLEHNVLNITHHIESQISDKEMVDETVQETFTSIESYEESSLEHNVLNITHHVESQISDKETSLNRTFETLNILNKTLPSVMNTNETEDYLSSEKHLKGIEEKNEQKNIAVSLRDKINETRSYACEPKKYEFTAEAKCSDKLLSRTVTKVKNKAQTSENRPNSSWTDDYQDFSKTGAKKKIFKSDKTLGPNLCKKSPAKTDPKNVRNKPRCNILSTTNRDLKTGTAFGTHNTTSMSPKISPHNITTISRGNFGTKRAMHKKVPNLSFKKIEKEPMSDLQKEKLRRTEIHIKNEQYTRKKYKESANLKGFADYKLSLCTTIKETQKMKSKREILEIPTIRLVTEPFKEQRDQRISRLPRRSSQIGRPEVKQGTRHLSRGRERGLPEPQRIPSTRHLSRGREPGLPEPQRIPSTRHLSLDREPGLSEPQRMPRRSGFPIPIHHVPPLPLGGPGEYYYLPPGSYSRIVGREYGNPQAIFCPQANQPFDSFQPISSSTNQPPVQRKKSRIPKKTAYGPSFPK